MPDLICDCPRATGIVHYENCPNHDPRSCAVCESDGHDSKLGYDKAIRELAGLSYSDECSKSRGSERESPGQDKVFPAMFRKCWCACELCEEVRRRNEILIGDTNAKDTR